MNRRDALELATAAGRFVDGLDQSARLAAEIEGIVIECCQDEPWFDDVSEALALFVPGGGGYYIDEHGLSTELRVVLAALARHSEDAP